MDEVTARSHGVRVGVAFPASAKRATQRVAEAAHERANPARNGETHAANAIKLERRKLSVKVVNLKPHRTLLTRFTSSSRGMGSGWFGLERR
jgi:hypothetical protein